MRTFYFIFALIILYSCNKSENLLEGVINENQIPKTDMLIFKSSNELNDAIQKAISLSTEELTNYEESIGFKSFGRKCEEIYFSIDPNMFKSLDEIRNYVNEYSEYLQLVKDENGEYRLETVHFDRPERYVINTQKMYRIDNIVYKLFNKGLAFTNIENIDLLKSINENNFLSFKDNSMIKIRENF